jgi:hypothetical protein
MRTRFVAAFVRGTGVFSKLPSDEDEPPEIGRSVRTKCGGGEKQLPKARTMRCRITDVSFLF